MGDTDGGGTDADVVIVGYGPVGVSAANFLGSRGVRTVVLERDKDIYPRARAVTVNDWTMRAFQSVGLDGALKADMTANGALSWKTYGGRTVFRLRPQACGIGHPGSMMIYQPAMEATLRAGVDRFAGVVDVRFGETATGVEQDADGVTLELAGGERIRARYLLACDGGSSRIRAAVGAQLLGTTHEVNWIVIDAKVLRWWPGCNDLTFWSDPDRPVVDIPLALGHHRWELPLGEGEDRAAFDSDEAIWRLLTPLGVTPAHVELESHAFYVHHVRHADRWRHGRVFLLGDAAHMMPPWAGQGMQSGIRDADNLTWKLCEVLAGRLGDEVLDTYQPERAPHVAAVTEMSQKLGMLIAGRDPRFVRLRNTLGPVLMRIPALTRRLMPSTRPAIETGWLTGPTGTTSAVGRMIPQPPVWDAAGCETVLDTALGTGFAVLGMDADPRAVMSTSDVEAWSALGARFLAVRTTATGASDDSDLIDHTGLLARWFRKHHARVVAVRPDRFVAAADPTGLALPSERTA